MKKGNVAIILVNYNGNNDTDACIQSLLHIGYKDYYIVVVDNGSSEPFVLDETKKEDNRIHCIYSKDNLGFSGGNNLGIRYALEILHSEYILLLNNDTIAEPDFLDKLLLASVKHPESIIGGKIYYFSDKKKLWYAGGEYIRKTGETIHIGFNEIDNGQYDKDGMVSFITGCLMLIPVSVINKIGLLPEEEFLYFEDTDYCCNAENNNIKLIYCHDAVIYHKVSASTKHRSKVQNYYMIRNGMRMISRYGTDKFYGYIKYIVKYCKLCIRKECMLSTLIKGILDFARGVTGRK